MPSARPLHREPDGDGARDPWAGGGGGFGGGTPAGGRKPEPAINAPWPALVLALSAPLGFALQHLGGDPLLAADKLGFRPSLLPGAGWSGLITALFVHAGWSHAILNGLAALAFGAPVARRFGRGAAAAAAFALFFVLCGVLGSLGFAAVQGGSAGVLVGASGGIAGLMGAASRMIPPGGAGLAPLTSRPVLAMAVAWIAVNLIFALIGLSFAGGGAPMAWQAHLAGYAAGLFLIAPALQALHPRG